MLEIDTTRGLDETLRRKPGRPSLSNEALLDKALDLFLEKGFAGTSIDAVCAAAGMAKRTVYARYGDKETLFKAALIRAIEDWIVPIPTLRAQECDDLELSLTRIGELLVENVIGPKGLRLLRLTNAESVAMPDIAIENVRLGTEPTLRYLADLFDRYLAHGDGKWPEAEDAAQAFISLVVGGIANNAAWGAVLEQDRIAHHVSYSVKLFLRGALACAPNYQSKAATVSVEGQAVEDLRYLLRDAEESLTQAQGRVERAREILS